MLDAVAEAPPPAFSGGGRWEAMRDEMAGFYEVRVKGADKQNHRLFCVLERDADDLGGSSIVVIDGLPKSLRTAAKRRTTPGCRVSDRVPETQDRSRARVKPLRTDLHASFGLPDWRLGLAFVGTVRVGRFFGRVTRSRSRTSASASSALVVPPARRCRRFSLLSGTLATVSTTIRVSQGTRDRFARLADATGRPMTQLVDEAVDALERRVFFDQLTAGYDALREDADAWAEVERERSTENGTLRDRSA